MKKSYREKKNHYFGHYVKKSVRIFLEIKIKVIFKIANRSRICTYRALDFNLQFFGFVYPGQFFMFLI